MGPSWACRWLGMASDLRTDRTRTSIREEAQTLAEYAVVLGVITPAIILALTVLSGNIRPLIDRISAFF
jgi:Flp pilus assembly pilin Flp